MYKIFVIAFIAFVVGMVSSLVGTVPECSLEEVAWYAPIQFLIILGMWAYLSYLAGVKDSTKE